MCTAMQKYDAQQLSAQEYHWDTSVCDMIARGVPATEAYEHLFNNANAALAMLKPPMKRSVIAARLTGPDLRAPCACAKLTDSCPFALLPRPAGRAEEELGKGGQEGPVLGEVPPVQREGLVPVGRRLQPRAQVLQVQRRPPRALVREAGRPRRQLCRRRAVSEHRATPRKQPRARSACVPTPAAAGRELRSSRNPVDGWVGGKKKTRTLAAPRRVARLGPAPKRRGLAEVLVLKLRTVIAQL